ncbi:acyltransferase [Blastococcus sp. TBT05-19]|uniref:acyltransferase family protein n=1 Tax=Blastococcus sp. TBT05-19 TaxID=2250581 RepID=UPI000DEB8B02|nr:acyltransferase family protein [Blastococcus sp. TBT05-19]RBY91751.1 acyltransferase [Blastococcus sp. TBT05-19]
MPVHRETTIERGTGVQMPPADDLTARIPAVDVGRAPARPARPAPRAEATSGVRVEIQALRALAVSLVVIYHVVPLRMPGGYVGVDVFFVVSGFLISGHLLREVERTQRIQLARFWARRARRLLPASLLVLLASAAATVLWVPQTYWQGWLREIGASAIYLENWVLAWDAVDYLAAHNVASPAQHYWSLATEEQFYLLWPLLVVGSVWLASRLRVHRRAAIAAVFGVLTAGSFAYSLWTTQTSPPDAYFTTPARAWEFGLGGLLAVWAATPPAGRHRLRTVVSWAGFGAIAYAAFAYTAETPFPGTAALLPVLGTVAVIWAGAPQGDWSPTKLADFGPVRFLGDISYSAYLWHWPLVVILPFALGHPLGTTSKAGIVVATLVAGYLTKIWVEDPVRTGTFLARRGTGTTFLATAVATAAVVAVAAAGWLHVGNSVAQAEVAAQAAASSSDPCFGAGAMLPGRDCADPFANQGDAANPIFAKSDASDGLQCAQGGTDTTPRTCRFGSSTPTETVALIGDSHTASLYEAFQEVAEDRDWAVVTYFKFGCPALGTDRMLGPGMPLDEATACGGWSQNALEQIAQDESITRVFTSYRNDIYKWAEDDGTLLDGIPVEAAQAPLRMLAEAGKQVHVVRAVPTTGGVHLGELKTLEFNVPDCVANAVGADDPCAGPRAVRVAPDHLADAALAMGDERVSVLDLTDAFCDAQTCHTLIGGVIVYSDGSHVTSTFSRTLGQFLDRQL